MAGDLVDDLIAEARKNAPQVPDSVWQGVEDALRAYKGGSKNDYIRRRPSRQRKDALIQRLEEATKQKEAAETTQLSQAIGVSVRTVERYIQLIK